MGLRLSRKLRISTTLSGWRLKDTCRVPITSRLMISGRAMVAFSPTVAMVCAERLLFRAERSLMTTGLRELMAIPATVLEATRVLESDSTTVPSAAVKRFRTSLSLS